MRFIAPLALIAAYLALVTATPTVIVKCEDSTTCGGARCVNKVCAPECGELTDDCGNNNECADFATFAGVSDIRHFCIAPSLCCPDGIEDPRRVNQKEDWRIVGCPGTLCPDH